MAKKSTGSRRARPLFTAMTPPQASMDASGGARRAAVQGVRGRSDAINVIATFVGVLGRLELNRPANRGGKA